MKTKTACIFLLMIFAGLNAQAQISDRIGNGGGVLPPVDNPVSVDEIRQMLQDSKPVIWKTLKWIEQEKAYSRPTDSPVTKNLLETHGYALEIINKVEILLSEKGCTDFLGNLVDGSINTPFRYGVCLSIDILQKKLNRNNYKSQILALMVHEMSHHLGATENDAIAIQREVLRFFVNKDDDAQLPNTDSEERQRLKYLSNADVFHTKLTGLSVRLRGGESVMCASTYVGFAGKSLTGGTTPIEGFMYLTNDLYKKWDSSNWRIIESISNYICSIPGRGVRDDRVRLRHRFDYDNGTVKFTSEADIANYIDGLQDDLNEYVKQVRALDLKYKIVDEAP